VGVVTQISDKPSRRRTGQPIARHSHDEATGALDGLPAREGENGKLRVSVHVAPQLFPTGNAVSTLAEFSDWQYWPATNVSFKVKIGPRTFDADIVSAPPSPSLWHVLFPSSTTVDPYEYQSPTSSPALQLPGRVRPPLLPEHLRGAREHRASRQLAGLPASDERGQFRRPAPRRPRALRTGSRV